MYRGELYFIDCDVIKTWTPKSKPACSFARKCISVAWPLTFLFLTMNSFYYYAVIISLERRHITFMRVISCSLSKDIIIWNHRQKLTIFGQSTDSLVFCSQHRNTFNDVATIVFYYWVNPTKSSNFSDSQFVFCMSFSWRTLDVKALFTQYLGPRVYIMTWKCDSFFPKPRAFLAECFKRTC